MRYRNFIKAMHISDLHLGKIFSAENLIAQDPSERREELWESFEYALGFCVKNEIDILLIAGDIYENESITVSDLDRLSKIFKKYSTINIFIALGNHDHISIKSEYLKNIIPPNCHIFENRLEYVEIDGFLRIYGFSWDRLYYREKPFEFEKLDSNYKNILLLHCMSGKESEHLPIDISELKNLGFDYCALGHIHKNIEITNSIRYSGALEPTKFKDEGEHGANLIYIDKNGLRVSFVNLAKRKYVDKTVVVKNIKNSEELNNFLAEEFKNCGAEDYLRLKVEGNIDSQLMENLKKILSLKYRHLEISENLSEYKSMGEIYEDNKNNILGYFMDYADENFSEDESKKLKNILINSIFLE